MATRLGTSASRAPEKSNFAWVLVVKVKYNGTLKRFNAHVNGSQFDHNLASLRSKIASAFKFSSDVEFILTYTDEDGDVVMLDDENDLHDAAVNQLLNPFRINVQLKNIIIKAPRTKGNLETSSGHVYGSYCSSSGGPQASRNTKIEHVNELMTGSASQSLDMQNAPGLKSVLLENPKAEVEQAPVCHSPDSLTFPSLGGKKSYHKGSTVTESKVRCNSQSKEKFIASSAMPPVSSYTYVATPVQYTPAPFVGENKLRYWPSYGYKGLVNSSMQFRGSPSVVPPYNRHLGSSGNINRDCHPSFATPASNTCSTPKLDMPSLVGTYVPRKDDLYPFRTSYKHNVPSSVSNNPERIFPCGCSYNYGSIKCDGCGASSIIGNCYKSNNEDDYILCVSCFYLMGNESEYTRLGNPASVKNRELIGHLQQGELKLGCSFISDITIPDGTSMAPSNPFIKIWRLRNSGCIVWPFGTQIIWVGGDQFALQSLVKLVISMNGVSGGQEVDVAVDCLAPAKPGRYISYWRLALPSRKKFGQQIWIHIQVEEPIKTSGNKLSAAINLNLPPAANSTTLKPSIDMNSGSKDPFFQYPSNIYNEIPPRYLDSKLDSPSSPIFQYPNYSESFACFQNPIILKESEPASSTLPSIPAAVTQVQMPTNDNHASSAGPALTSMTATVLAPETIPLPKYASFDLPVSASSVPAPASFPVQTSTCVPTTVLPCNIVNHKEEKLLREMEELGFGHAHLNKELLRQNKYDQEQSVRNPCGLSDRDPLLGEQSELGFHDAEMNKEDVAEGGEEASRGL